MGIGGMVVVVVVVVVTVVAAGVVGNVVVMGVLDEGVAVGMVVAFAVAWSL